MAQRYASFLIRCWRMGAGLRRFNVSHIQSGDVARMESLSAAIAWIEARVAQEAAAEDASGSDPPDGSSSNPDDDHSSAP